MDTMAQMVATCKMEVQERISDMAFWGQLHHNHASASLCALVADQGYKKP